MSAETLNLKLRYHEGSVGGPHVEKHYIPVKEDGKDSKGIHFHFSRLLTPAEATVFLRRYHYIERHEAVLAVINCGRDLKGNHGYAARTDGMAEPEEAPIQKPKRGLLKMLHLHRQKLVPS